MNRDKKYKKVRRLVAQLDGEFLYAGHALAGMDALMVAGGDATTAAEIALKLARQYRCTVLVEMHEVTEGAWFFTRIWVPRDYFSAACAEYGARS